MATVTPFPTPTVFIVDSDTSLREPLAAQFRGAGWQPRFASSAEEFLAQPRALTVCCLLVELQLPGITGLDLQRLVADRVEMPVIFMSRQADIPATVRAMKAGAIEFLTKPLASEPLLRAIEDGLRLSTGALRKFRRAECHVGCTADVVATEIGNHIVERRQRFVQAGEGGACIGVRVHDAPRRGVGEIDRCVHHPFTGRGSAALHVPLQCHGDQ